jgi:ubiquinone/menaquinone biosynthesis C-methylase UbiE
MAAISHRIVQQVKKTYSAIAEEFDATRKAPWPEFKAINSIIKKFKGHVKILDIGCGNGRLFHYLKGQRISYVGIDNNRKMLSLAKQKILNKDKAKFRLAEMTRLPFPDHSFDLVCCIAALHHLPTPKLQLKALKEMRRVCKKNGFCIITVWNLWQPKYKKFIQSKNHHAWIPWGNKKSIQRFYYAFTKKELTDLIKKSGFTKTQNIRSKHNFATMVS